MTNPEHATQAPANPERATKQFGLSVEAQRKLAEHLGSGAHEQNMSLEQALDVKEADSILVNEAATLEQMEAAGMSRQQFEEFVHKGYEASRNDGSYDSASIEVPSYVQPEQAEAFKHLAESGILRMLLGNGNSKAYDEAIGKPESYVQVIGTEDPGVDKKVVTAQVVDFIGESGKQKHVEVVRTFAEDGTETGLMINAA